MRLHHVVPHVPVLSYRMACCAHGNHALHIGSTLVLTARITDKAPLL